MLEVLLGLALLLNLIFWPGFLTIGIAGHWPSEVSALDTSEVLILSFVTGLLYLTLGTFTLAYLGIFSVHALTALMLAASGLLVAIGMNSKQSPLSLLVRLRRLSLPALVALLMTLIAFLLFSQPSENILLNWDDGTYVNTGANIVLQGSITHREPSLELVPESLRMLFFDLRPGLLTPSQFKDYGFWIDWDMGTVLPQYFHAYPSLLGAFISFTDLPHALYANAMLAALSVGVMFILGNRVGNLRAGVLASAFLLTSFPQLWFSRFPSAEILFQLLLLTGALTFFLLLRTQQPVFGILSGASLASTILVRLDGLFLVPAVAVLLLLVGKGLRQRSRISFGGAYLGVFAHSTLYLTTTGFQHTRLQLVGLGLDISPALLAVIMGITLGFILFLVLRPPELTLTWELTRSLALGFSAVAASLLLWIFLVAPQSDPGTYGWNLLAVSVYTTPMALALGLAGLLALAHRSAQDVGMLAVLLLPVPFFIVYIQAAYVQLFFPWFLRRWIQAAIPFLLLGAALGIDRITQVKPGKDLQSNLLAILLAAAILLPSIFLSLPYVSFRENRGLIQATAQLAERLDGDSIVIFYSRSGGFALPLAYIHGLRVVELQSDPFSSGLGDEFLAALDGWMRENLTVYLVNPSASFLAILSRTHPPSLSWSDEVEMVQYRMAYASHDFDLARRIYPLAVYEIGPRSAQPTLPMIDELGLIGGLGTQHRLGTCYA